MKPARGRDPYVDGPRAGDRCSRWLPRLDTPATGQESHGMSRTSDRSILPSDFLAAPARPVGDPTARLIRHAAMQGSARRRNFRPSSSASRDADNLVDECHGRKFCRRAGSRLRRRHIRGLRFSNTSSQVVGRPRPFFTRWITASGAFVYIGAKAR
jgi:hypothetical protein